MSFSNMVKSAREYDFSNRKNIFDAISYRNNMVFKALNKSRSVADDKARMQFAEEADKLKRDWKEYVKLAEIHFYENQYNMDFFGRMFDILALSKDERIKSVKGLSDIVSLYYKGYRDSNGVLRGERSFISLYHYYQSMQAYAFNEELINEIIGFEPENGEFI